MYFDRLAAKMEVRRSMRQTRPHPMLATLLFLVLTSVGAGLISWLVNTVSSRFSGDELSLMDMIFGIIYYGEEYLEYLLEYAARMVALAMVISLVTSILTAAWNGLMNTGYAGYCLDMSRDRNPPLEHIFNGFYRAGAVMSAYILVAIFTFLWVLLFTVGLIAMFFFAAWLAVMLDGLVALGALVVFASLILYAAAVIWVTYRYAMVPFIFADCQEPITAMDAIRASALMMRGRKGSLFVLRLSFIGWYLLQGLVVVIGAVIAVVSVAGNIGTFVDLLDDLLYAGDFEEIIWLLTHIFAPILPIALVCGAIIFILNLWLTPYRTGCEAHFYLYASGGAQPNPYQPGLYDGQSGPYGGQSDPYGGWPGGAGDSKD